MEQRIYKELASLQFGNVNTFVSGIRTATILMSIGYAVAKLAVYLSQHQANSVTAMYLGGVAMMFVGLITLVLDVGRYRTVKRALALGLPPRTHEEHAYMFAGLIGVTGLLLMFLLFVDR